MKRTVVLLAQVLEGIWNGLRAGFTSEPVAMLYLVTVSAWCGFVLGRVT